MRAVVRWDSVVVISQDEFVDKDFLAFEKFSAVWQAAESDRNVGD